MKSDTVSTTLDMNLARLVFLIASVASANLSADPITELTITDGVYSANATRLIDGNLGAQSNDSWSNSGNPWNADSYPMHAVVDLGAAHQLDSIRIFAGQIPSPQSASVRFEQSDDNVAFAPLAVIASPDYNQWTPTVELESATARYLRVRFDTRDSRFNLSEIEINGQVVEEVVTPEPPTTGEPTPITGVTATDTANSSNASRLIDSLEPWGTDDANSWTNPQPWDSQSYPMTAELDLGELYQISAINYFVGNLNQDSASLQIEYSASAQGDDFGLLTTVSNGHRWGKWREVELAGQAARRLRLIFADPQSRFNISEFQTLGIRVMATTSADLAVTVNNGQTTYAGGMQSTYAIAVANEGPGNADGSQLLIDLSAQLTAINWNCQGESGAVCPQASGTGPIDTAVDALPAGSRLVYTIDTVVDSLATTPVTVSASATVADDIVDANPGNNTAVDKDISEFTPPVVVDGDMPKTAVPGDDVVRAYGFGSWPSDHLSATCAELHNRYWTKGPGAGGIDDPNHPENRAYHTWHPALAVHPETGERCDFGHEHGTDPSLAPAEVFELAGGWPAFGYAAEVANGARHEDHVGHKITVARFGASIGNGAGSDTLYDAGFECDWLSKIHQGSYSMDAFANHLHEYFLTLRCFDGRDEQGVMDGTRVGTALSVKVVYTWGEPNRFRETDCTAASVFPSHIVTGPEGQKPHHAMQVEPTGSNPNHREFTCLDSIKWKALTDIDQVDLWTEAIKIYSNTGHAVMSMQPYYIVKNPARVISQFSGNHAASVIRTVDVCYDENGDLTKFPICQGAPDPKPEDWEGWTDTRSPFNGALRAVNFKSTALYNSDGTETFCTDAFGGRVTDVPPCEANHIEQRAAVFDNNWNNGRYEYNNRIGNVAGSIWATAPNGTRFESARTADGGYVPRGLGHEFIIDNRNPDDDGDGVPDGANLRGEN